MYLGGVEPKGFDSAMRNNISMDINYIFNDYIIEKYKIDELKYWNFEKQLGFDVFYRKGIWPRYERKIAEYFIAYNFLGLDRVKGKRDFVYIDGAASSSPWAKWLRDNLEIKSYAVDINKPVTNSNIYIQADITQLPFNDESVDAISLQSALETFPGNVDIEFIKECGRVLKPGGKCVIVPLYLNSEYVNAYGPSYYRKTRAEKQAIKYYRFDYNMPFTRLLDVKNLKSRICDIAEKSNMNYQLFELEENNLNLIDKQYPYIYFKYFIGFYKYE